MTERIRPSLYRVAYFLPACILRQVKWAVRQILTQKNASRPSSLVLTLHKRQVTKQAFFYMLGKNFLKQFSHHSVAMYISYTPKYVHNLTTMRCLARLLRLFDRE